MSPLSPRSIRELFEDDIVAGSRAKPPIIPDPVAMILVAVSSPLISASDAVIAPLFVTLN